MRTSVLRLAIVALWAVSACSRTDVFGESQPIQTGPTITTPEVVTVLPPTVTVDVGATTQFTATAAPSLPLAHFTWSIVNASADSGTIDQTGLYTAPMNIPGGGPAVTVQASLMGSSAATGAAVVTIINTPLGPPTTILKISGDNQMATVGEVLGQPLVVEVVDNSNPPRPVSGVSVSFLTPGSMRGVPATTNVNGTASFQPSAGTVAGMQQFTVSSTGLETVTFTVDAAPGPLATLTLMDSSMQGTAGSTIIAPLTATFADQYGNLLANHSASGFGPAGSSVTPTSMVSNASGQQTFSIGLASMAGAQVFTFVDNVDASISATITFNAVSGAAASLQLVSGDMQTGTVGATLMAPLVVLALDANGIPVANVPLTWTGSGGTLLNAQPQTGTSGQGSTQFQLGTTAGVSSVTVTSTAVPGAQVTFAETAQPGPATSLTLVSGSNQTTAAGQPFGGAFSVIAKDRFGNAVSGVAVNFAATSGGGSVNPRSAVTNASGLAQTTMTAGALGGSEVFTASSMGLTPVSITLNASGPLSYLLAVTSGNNQTGVVSTALAQQLVVTVTANGQPAPGQTVTFGVSQGGGSILPTSVVTDMNGQARATATLGSVAGMQQFSASMAAATNSPVFFNETATGDTVATLVAISGSGQSALPGNQLPQPFVVEALDSHGVPVAGATIVFSPPMGGSVAPTSVTTGSNGEASSQGFLSMNSGTQDFTATSGNASVVFVATATSNPPQLTISIVSGNNQTGTAGAALANNLVVEVVDSANGNTPVSGVTINWSAIGGGTILNGQTQTQSNGQATAQLTLSQTAGPETVSVTAQGAAGATVANSPVTFVANATPGPATTLVLVSGSGQTTTAGQLFGGAFSVRATDSFGNGVSAVTINFSVVAGGGSISPASGMTDANGLAQAQMTAGAAGGTETYEAKLNGTSASVQITLMATPPGVYHLVVISGGGQSGAVGSALPQPLVVEVTLNGMQVSGQTLTFAVSMGDGSVAPVQATTGTNGQASVKATLGSTAGSQIFAASLPSADDSPVFFDETATGASVALLRVVSGSGQSSNPGSALALPLVVQALGANGLPVAGATITWTAPTGGRVSSTTVTTDANGEAQVNATLNMTTGTQTFAAASGSATATFTETSTMVMTGLKIEIVSGNNQTGEVGSALAEPLVVVVTNGGGAPKSGITVSWAGVSALATVSAATVTTGANGQAQVTATLGKPIGTQTFTASCAMCTGSPATFTENGTAAPASKLVVAGGDGQSGLVHSVLPSPLVAEAEDVVGNPVAGVVITFAAGVGGGSITPTSGTSGSNGEVSTTATLGSQTGPETFTASAPGLGSVTFTATATEAVSSISISPQNLSLDIGGTQQYVATAIYTDGTTGVITNECTWSTADAGTATIVASGTGAGDLKAVAAGSTTVKATFGGKTGSTPVTVNSATLSSIVVTPANLSIAKGSTHQMVATATYSDMSVSTITASCTWTSSDTMVATVSNTGGSQGVITAVSSGTSIITCSYMGVTGSRSITVVASPIVQLQITPTNVAQPVGSGAQFTATATFADGTVQNVTGAATWSSSDTSKMTVQNAPAQAGLATFIAAGTPDVIAKYDGLTAQVTVTISMATVTSLSLSAPQLLPMNGNATAFTIVAGSTQQLVLTAQYSDGTVATVTALASWTSSDSAAADVSNAPGTIGLVTAVAAGNATITATYGGKSVTSAVTVDSGNTLGMLVFQANTMPRGFMMVTVNCDVGGTVSLWAGIATGNPPNFMLSLVTTAASWSTSDGTIAVVGNGTTAGVVQCLKAGSVTITAEYMGQTSGATVDVSSATLTSITISPTSLSLAANGEQTLTATGTWSDGTTTNVTALGTWTSSDTMVATASNAAGSHGKVAAVGAGMTTVTITYQGQTASIPVTVSAATVVGVVVSPSNDAVTLRMMGGGPGGGGGGRPQTLQYSAVALLSDGTQQDVTDLVVWSVVNPAGTIVADISNTAPTQGQATILARGTCTIDASYNGTIHQSTTLTVN